MITRVYWEILSDDSLSAVEDQDAPVAGTAE